MSGILARRAHTLYAPGTPEECRQLIDVGTADDASRRLNLQRLPRRLVGSAGRDDSHLRRTAAHQHARGAFEA